MTRRRGAPAPRARGSRRRALPSTGVRPVDATAPRRSAPNAAVAILRRGCGARGLVESDVDRIWLPRPASGAVRKKKNFSLEGDLIQSGRSSPSEPRGFFSDYGPMQIDLNERPADPSVVWWSQDFPDRMSPASLDGC